MSKLYMLDKYKIGEYNTIQYHYIDIKGQHIDII